MIIDYISLSADGKTWKIPTNLSTDSTMTKNMYITDVSGLLEPGESTSEAVPYSYRDGSVIPLVPFFRGKDISVSIVFVGGGQTALRNFQAVYRAMLTGNTKVSSNAALGPFTCNLTRVDISEKPDADYIVASFQFQTREAY